MKKLEAQRNQGLERLWILLHLETTEVFSLLCGAERIQFKTDGCEGLQQQEFSVRGVNGWGRHGGIV